MVKQLPFKQLTLVRFQVGAQMKFVTTLGIGKGSGNGSFPCRKLFLHRAVLKGASEYERLLSGGMKTTVKLI